MSIMIPGLVRAVRDAAQGHFDWCNLPEHDYATPEHEAQLCKSSSEVRFPKPYRRGDEVVEFAVELAGSHSDVAHDIPVPLASVAFNGQIPGWDMEPWKLVPLAMVLLSAEARSRGDVTMERAYLDAANDAIDAHVIEAEHDAEPAGYVVAQRPVQVLNRTQGPYSYIEGLDPEVDVMPWPDYQAAQAVEPGAPAYVVQHTEPGHWQLTSIETGKSVDGIDYTSFETAAAERDLRNAEQAGGAL